MSNSMTIITRFIFVCAGVILFSFGCNSTDPPVDNAEPLNLSLEDVSCTEAWLKISGEAGSIIALNRDDKEIMRFNLTDEDTTILNNSLLPNKSYTYQVFSSDRRVKSNEVTLTTMDTTGNDFKWQSWTFGGQSGSCVLHDVAVIDENNIWAVGLIFLPDSSDANNYKIYNAVHWDGEKWEIKRIYYYGQCSVVMYPELATIFVFFEENLLLSDAGSIGYFSGKDVLLNCEVNSIITGSIKKIWGINQNNFYIAGNKGNIAHYNGSKWRKLESGTSLNINDIWGEYNSKTDKYEILAVASSIYDSFEKEVLNINSNSVEVISKEGIEEVLSSVWFKPGRKYYVAGSGIYEKHRIDDASWKGNPLDITRYFIHGLRGNDINDITAVGGYGEVLHFNGVSWKSFYNETKINGNYGSVDMKQNIIATVGYHGESAVITLGIRRN